MEALECDQMKSDSELDPILRVSDLVFRWTESEITLFKSLDFEVRRTEILGIVGQSGVGKSTLLLLLAGLIDPSSGSILMNGKTLDTRSGEIGFVFQDYALFSWLNVFDNASFGLRMRGKFTKSERQRVEHILEVVGLKNDQGKYPNQLSGGMKQRVAIARALAGNPEILLMDEPFAALDVRTRNNTQELILSIWEEFQSTIVFVTHDIDDPILLGDRILVMDSGRQGFADEIEIGLSRPRDISSQGFNRIRTRLLGNFI